MPSKLFWKEATFSIDAANRFPICYFFSLCVLKKFQSFGRRIPKIFYLLPANLMEVIYRLLTSSSILIQYNVFWECYSVHHHHKNFMSGMCMCDHSVICLIWIICLSAVFPTGFALPSLWKGWHSCSLICVISVCTLLATFLARLKKL